MFCPSLFHRLQPVPLVCRHVEHEHLRALARAVESSRHNDHRSILVTRTQKVDISKEGVGKKQGYLMEVKTIRCIIVINEKKHYVLEINLEFF